MHILDEKDYVIKDSSVPNAGKGLFCKRDIPAGTMVPYNTIVKKEVELSEDEDRIYHMTISYFENNKEKYMRKFVSDGHPKYFKGSKKKLSVGSRVNEASLYPPNCIFVVNPFVTKEDFINAYKNTDIITSCFLLVPFGLKKGQELFTMYGPSYGREYKQWRDRNGYRDNLIDEAHEIMNDKDNMLELYSIYKS